MTPHPRILIVGAGIAGLALARALQLRGLEAEVVERDAGRRQAGSGLYLPANAVRMLNQLGVGHETSVQGVPVVRQHLLDHRSRSLLDVDLHELWGEVGPCLAISRSALHEILLASVDRASVRLGVGVTRVEDGSVVFDDGTTRTFDLVVGADGIGSTVRRSAFTSAEPHFLGQVCWRFIAEHHPEITDWTVRTGPGGRVFLTVALGGGRVYCYAEAGRTEPKSPDGDWRELFSRFTGPVPELLQQGTGGYFAPLAEIAGSDWVRPRTVLIGDAAHACSPSMAQGGAMALEGAVVLAETLATQPVVQALESYRSRRADRVAWVLAQNHRRDRARSLPTPLRNALLRFAGRKLIAANHAPLLTLP